MTQPILSTLTIKKTKVLQRGKLLTTPPTLWQALEENHKIKLLKCLAEMVRRAKESQMINQGGNNELN